MMVKNLWHLKVNQYFLLMILFLRRYFSKRNFIIITKEFTAPIGVGIECRDTLVSINKEYPEVLISFINCNTFMLSSSV